MGLSDLAELNNWADLFVRLIGSTNSLTFLYGALFFYSWNAFRLTPHSSWRIAVDTVLRESVGAFAKLWKATISFVLSVRPSVLIELLTSYWTDFHEILFFSIFRKYVKKIHVSWNHDKKALLFFSSSSFFFTLDAGLLARSQYSEGPATGHLDTGFSRFPCV